MKKDYINGFSMTREDEVCKNPGLVPYPHHRGSPIIRPQKIEAPIEKVELAANQKLEILRRQADHIMEEANNIMENVELTKEIYSYEIRFEPSVGDVYYAYEREDGTKSLSLMGNHQWDCTKYNLKFLFAVTFLADETWSIQDEEL